MSRAYRRLRSHFHPDKPNGDAVTFHAMPSAYEQYQKGSH